MNTLTLIFNHQSLKIYGTTNDPYFIVNDICDIVEIDRSSTLVRRIINQQDFIRAGQKPDLTFVQYQGTDKAVVNEFGLYEILFRSSSKLEQDFRREIYEYLRATRIQQGLISEDKLQKEQQKTQEALTLNNEIQQLADENKQLANEKQKQLDKILHDKNTSHRIVLIQNKAYRILHVFSSHKDQYENRCNVELQLVIGAGENPDELLTITMMEPTSKKNAMRSVKQFKKLSKYRYDIDHTKLVQ